MTLSIIIPTLNEEQDLPHLLQSIKDLSDETVIIDSGSKDRTLEIAKKSNAKIYHHDFLSFSDTRNFGDTKAKGDWILSLEADVIITPDLAQEIMEKIQDANFSAFYIERKNIIWGDFVNHTDWGPKDDCHIWLYKKGSGKWSGLVHEEYKTIQKVGKLKSRLIHQNYHTVGEFIAKIDKYSELDISQGKSFPWWYFARDFVKRYFYKKGYLDGYRGIFLSFLQSIYFITLLIKQKTR